MTVHIRSLKFLALIAGVLLLSGCAETQLVSHWAKQVTWPGQQEAGPQEAEQHRAGGEPRPAAPPGDGEHRDVEQSEIGEQWHRAGIGIGPKVQALAAVIIGIK